MNLRGNFFTMGIWNELPVEEVETGTRTTFKYTRTDTWLGKVLRDIGELEGRASGTS